MLTVVPSPAQAIDGGAPRRRFDHGDGYNAILVVEHEHVLATCVSEESTVAGEWCREGEGAAMRSFLLGEPRTIR